MGILRFAARLSRREFRCDPVTGRSRFVSQN